MVQDKKSKRRDPVPGLYPRRAALDLILAVRRDGRLLSDIVDAPDSPLVDLDPQDRARAQRLATETLRHAGRIDKALQPYLRKAPHVRVAGILSLAVAELCVDRAAPHGVVNAAVALTRTHPKTGHQAGMVNAVLRRVAEEVAPDWDRMPPSMLPRWLRRPLQHTYGQAALAGIERALLTAPPLDLTPKDGDAPALADRLGGVALPTGSVRLATAGQVSALPGYDTGDWWVQDAAAAIPARVLNAQKGEKILDLCAAPGGKTLQLAATGAEITALDVSKARLRRLRENLDRCRLTADVIAADALHWDPQTKFDAILLDAPCTATGTLRRHPDLPWVKTAEDTAPLVDLQAQMLDRAFGWLAPGGRLIYCTCSLLPEEGEAQVQAALTRHEGLTVTPLRPDAYGLNDAAATDTGLRLRPDFWPEAGHMDGFFIAQLHHAP